MGTPVPRAEAFARLQHVGLALNCAGVTPRADDQGPARELGRDETLRYRSCGSSSSPPWLSQSAA
ncbi:hypothetical protein [Kitasatospora sp. NBC_00315]|uniref:hypothetical protein n=1 Tax=Kitasatospora sp. NBC_00315 TaxID=2975963 RepID=UPI00352C525A